MIVSASYKTDIPAFYGEWFMNRLKAGYCRVRNPVSGKPFRVSLRREDIDGIVFWTKNPWPFLDRLGHVAELGYPFYVQFTITPYDRLIERSVISPDRAVEAAKKIRQSHGSDCVAWRYDPIIISKDTPIGWHLDSFRTLASQLEGVVNEVATKFLVPHEKTQRNLAAISVRALDAPLAEKQELLEQMASIATAHGINLKVCAQPEVAGQLPKAVCLDMQRLMRLGAPSRNGRTKSNRPGCLCHEASDIGEYDTCPQGCAYCYATVRQSIAIRRHGLHNPTEDSLIPLPPEVGSQVKQLQMFEVN